MNDRELLELAAKAAGLQSDEAGPYVERPCLQSEFGKGNWIENVKFNWNPLSDDGDALRLAVKLRIGIDPWGASVVVSPGHDMQQLSEPYGSDPYAATRRAIVRAAAEIGRAMK